MLRKWLKQFCYMYLRFYSQCPSLVPVLLLLPLAPDLVPSSLVWQPLSPSPTPPCRRLLPMSPAPPVDLALGLHSGLGINLFFFC